jgi:hypothetical protein
MKSFPHRNPDIGIRRQAVPIDPLVQDERTDVKCCSRSLSGVTPLSSDGSRGLAIAALAIGAVAFGALAVGALAVGSFLIGRLRVKRSHFGTLKIDNLRVGSLDVQQLKGDGFSKQESSAV